MGNESSTLSPKILASEEKASATVTGIAALLRRSFDITNNSLLSHDVQCDTMRRQLECTSTSRSYYWNCITRFAVSQLSRLDQGSGKYVCVVGGGGEEEGMGRGCYVARA